MTSDVERRLLFVVHYPVYGGPHNRALRLAEPLRAHGWSTHVLLPDEPGNAVQRFQDAGIPTTTMRLHRLRVSRSPMPHVALIAGLAPEVLRIRRLIRSLDIDLVVIGGLVNPHAALAARMAGVPVAWQIIDSRAPQLVRATLRPLVQRLASVVMTTGTTIADEHGVSSRMRDRWFPFFSPVDVDRFVPDPRRRTAARRELGFGDNDLVIGTVGTLNPQKGHATFIRAASEVLRSHPNARFLILGAGHDTHQHLERELWGLAHDLGLQLGTNLVVRDPGARVNELAPAIDVFWLTSEPRSEGVPTVLMEAMAMAIPVVSTDVGGVREIVEDGLTGFVVSPRSPGDQARATLPLLEDPDLRARIGAEGRAQATSRFRTDACLDVHLRAFEFALEYGSGGR